MSFLYRIPLSVSTQQCPHEQRDQFNASGNGQIQQRPIACIRGRCSRVVLGVNPRLAVRAWETTSHRGWSTDHEPHASASP